MRIVVFGSTGMVGSRIVDELSRRGHEVVGATRSSGSDISSVDAVASVAAGADVVVSAVSARGNPTGLRDAAESLVDGLRRSGVRRVIAVGGAGSLEVAPGVRLVDSPEFPADYKEEALDGAASLGFYRGVDDLDWTFVSPAAFIHPGERTGRYQLGGDQMLTDAAGNSEISAEDFAIAIADLVDSGDHVRARVGVAW